MKTLAVHKLRMAARKHHKPTGEHLKAFALASKKIVEQLKENGNQSPSSK